MWYGENQISYQFIMNTLSRSCCFKRLLLLLLFSVFNPLAAQKKHFTYEQAYDYSGSEVLAMLPEIDGWLDADHYLQYHQDNDKKTYKLIKVNARDGRATDFIDYNSLSDCLENLDLRYAEDISSDRRSYILKKEDDLYYFSLTDKKLQRLTNTPGVEKNPVLSPDGRYVAFTRDHDLYSIDIQSFQEKRLTYDGDQTVYNGWAAWLYYEEVLGRASRYRAFWWSPNSESIAFLRFDETKVPEFPLFDAEGTHGQLELQRYSKAGDPIPQVLLGIIDLKTVKINWIDFDREEEHYFAQPFWSPDSKYLLAQWFNRSQDLARLYRIDPGNGQKKLIYEEKSDTWIEFYTDIYILKNSNSFILRSDSDGWYHLYYYDMVGLGVKLTSGKWNVTSLVHVDEQRQQVYFISTAEHATQKHLYRVNFSGKNLQRLTDTAGVHDITISPEAKYFIDTYSNINQPPKMDLCRSDGKVLRTIGDSKTAMLDEYELGRVEIFSIPTEDGLDLPALWILPPKIEIDKRYPVIFRVYGAPEMTLVENWYRPLNDHFLAQQGIITIVVDNRGSGHFGKAGMTMMNRQLGKWEVNDLVTAVKWLRQQPFVDSTRIGIIGGSYGGYVTCMALTCEADYFTHGVARYPVTDWRLYDATYSERYMDKPEENPQGYELSSVMTHAQNYHGKLLLIHGSMDDNVHFQNTLQLISKLQDLGKNFEIMIYPAQRHGLRGLKESHGDRVIYDFWIRNVLELN
jgi:dipeptidyl-peptidase 4